MIVSYAIGVFNHAEKKTCLKEMIEDIDPLQLSYPVSLASERNAAFVSGRFVNHVTRNMNHAVRNINPLDAIMKKIKRMLAIFVKCAVAFVLIWLFLGLRGFFVVFLLWYIFNEIDRKLKR